MTEPGSLIRPVHAHTGPGGDTVISPTKARWPSSI